jgi:hypothetical protein
MRAAPAHNLRRYREHVEEPAVGPARAALGVRLGLAAFVLAWLLGPAWLQAHVPILLVFALALGLEVHFFLSARRAAPPAARDRGPQDVDRELYGYGAETDELLVVREGGEELWLPYSGQTDEEVEELLARARELEDDEEDDLQESWEAERAAASLPPRRPVRRLVTGVGVICALALVLWVAQARTGWNGLDGDARAQAEKLFSEEASRIAGKPVSIRCDADGEHVGVVQHADGAAVVGGNVGWLTPERCYDLYRLAVRGETSSSQTGRAIAVLAHEAWHLHGIRDEARTECYALQSGVELGTRLGLAEETARQLMRQRLSENVLHARSSPQYLVPAECRAGGELDLNPGSDRFP